MFAKYCKWNSLFIKRQLPLPFFEYEIHRCFHFVDNAVEVFNNYLHFLNQRKFEFWASWRDSEMKKGKKVELRIYRNSYALSLELCVCYSFGLQMIKTHISFDRPTYVNQLSIPAVVMVLRPVQKFEWKICKKFIVKFILVGRTVCVYSSVCCFCFGFKCIFLFLELQ